MAPRQPVTWIIGFLIMGFLLIMFRATIVNAVRAGAVIACLLTLASVVSVVRVNPGRPISLGSTYAALFGLFHIGLLIPLAFGVPVRLLNPTDGTWVGSPGFASAAFLVSVAQTAMTLGYLLRARGASAGSSRIDDQPVATEAVEFADGSAVVGTGLLVVGLLLWTHNAIVAGVSLAGSYPDFLAATANTSMPTADLLIGFGMAVVSSSHRSVVRRSALIVFALWAIPAFLLGLRGEVIIPAAAFLVVTARRRPVPLRAWMGLPVLGALAVGSAVRVVRQVGVANGAVRMRDLNPLNGLAELGYSIRPLTVVSDVHDRFGQPFVGMATYLAPFRRFIVGRLLGGHVLSVADDPAVFGGWILKRVGPIGGSPAAEAYRSGGLVAMVAVMAIVGIVIASLDSLRSSPLKNATVGMLTFVLLLWVRNDFTPVPAECLLTVPVVMFIWLLSQDARIRSRVGPELVRRP